MSRKHVFWGLVILALVVGAVSFYLNLQPPSRLPAVPVDAMMRAEIPGIPNARYWVMMDVQSYVHDVIEARQREQQRLGGAELPPAALLAVSGGGDNGAFGAGLLCGWTESGRRPEFKAVTGVSTGALIAPFAFLGPDFDEVLRTVYTSLGPQDIASERSFLAAINNDALADNRPLWNQLSRYVNEDLLRRIAEEHAKGRLLLVGTTNIDARQPVIWNIGAIASSGAPGALDLVRNVLVASAAIPGAFPPTMIRVQVDGKEYEEMHVDGGTSAQVFLYPPRLRFVAASLGHDMSRQGTVYVIRNSTLRPQGMPVRRRTINIAGPAIASLIFTQGLGDLNRIYLTTLRDGLDFNLAIIGDDFTVEHTTDFDTAYMKALFDHAHRQAKVGYPWRKVPPTFEDLPPLQLAPQPEQPSAQRPAGQTAGGAPSGAPPPAR